MKKSPGKNLIHNSSAINFKSVNQKAIKFHPSLFTLKCIRQFKNKVLTTETSAATMRYSNDLQQAYKIVYELL
jgi:hypothetical protein